MANQRPKVAYGLSEPYFGVGPIPIVVGRAPLTSDFAEIGTFWIDPLNNNIWALTSVVANIASWEPLGTINYGTGIDGQTLIGATGGLPIWANIIPGAGITITNAPHSITISSTNGGFVWGAVAANGPFINGQGVIVNKVGLLTMTLPVVAAVGTQIGIQGTAFGAAGWTIAQAAGQSIQIGAGVSSTIGVGGSVSSTLAMDGIVMVCVTANTTWKLVSSNGNLIVV